MSIDYHFFFRVRMDFPRPRIENISKTLLDGLDDALAGSPIKVGDTVAVGVGSRGIANLALIVKTCCTCLIKIGANRGILFFEGRTPSAFYPNNLPPNLIMSHFLSGAHQTPPALPVAVAG